jgi:DeoR/GlpR family transcriptional regulator of sugar metabolism
MLSYERHSLIIEELRNSLTVTVEALSKLLNVSENTIRRDLNTLEKAGKLKRIQGGAIGVSDRSVLGKPLRVDSYEQEKMAIGLLASQFITNQKTYIVDAGTSTMVLAPYLSKISMSTILTNSLDICNKVAPQSGSSLICSGGVLIQGLHSFVGKPAEDFFKTVHADYAFIGTKSISDGVLANENFFEVPIKQRMLEAADHVIVLADHSKFGHHGLCDFATLGQIDTIITDWKIDKKFISEIEKQGVNVLVADPINNEGGGMYESRI